MLDRFTTDAIEIIVLAQDEARRREHNHVDTAHILQVLLRDDCSGVHAFVAAGLNPNDARSAIEAMLGVKGNSASAELPFSDNAKDLLSCSQDQAIRLGQQRIGIEHIILALSAVSQDASPLRELVALGLDCSKLRAQAFDMVPKYVVHLKRDSEPVAQPNKPTNNRVMQYSQEEAFRLGHNFIGTEQILVGLIAERTGIAARALKSVGLNLKIVQIEVERLVGRGSGFVAIDPSFTPRAKRVLELSWEEARLLGHTHIGSEHLLLGLLAEGANPADSGVAAQALRNLNIDLTELRTKILSMIAEEDEPTATGR